MSEPVVDNAHLAALRAIAEGRRTAPTEAQVASSRGSVDRAEAFRAIGVVLEKPAEAKDMYGEGVSLSTAPESLTADAQAAFLSDLEHVDPVALVRAYPRDKNGFLLGVSMLLASYEPLVPNKRKRPWLVARGPLKRSHPPVIALLFDVIDAETFPEQWPRHVWDRRAMNASEETRWGVRGLPLPLLDAEDRPARIANLITAGTEGERAALATLLLDEGHFAEAFAVYGIELTAELAPILAGSSDGERWGVRWRTTLRARLHRAAPWLLANVPLAAKGRTKTPRVRLFNLPYGSAARRPGVFLEQRDRQRVLHVDFSGSNGYLAEPAWMRPIELELLRFGLA